MALLGLGKKPAPEKKEEVPEELPDLPQGSSNTNSSPEKSAPDELPPVERSLAPDELPPVAGFDTGAEINVKPGDRRLYFAQLLQKLHDEGLKSTKLSSPTANLLSDMKKHWKQQKKVEEAEEMVQKVANTIAPLQRLEEEWSQLYDEIEAKKQLLQQKEEEIKRLSEQLKDTAAKAEKMRSSLD